MRLEKSYQPNKYETSIYSLWEKSGAFLPKSTGNDYSIVMPPPNANANLHMGHALTIAIEDIAVRYHRSKGDRVVFVPGADHAGFETQVVYERKLANEGKSRFDYSREDLYKNIYEFVASNRDIFTSQIRALGASVDWSRFVFSLDEPVVKNAYATFSKMWHDGLIYRGERLVNYCTYHGTAFADIEVLHKEEKGHLWSISYPLVNENGALVVATTRPETLFGDTAVAVNPHDPRYQSFIGKTLKLPLTDREIPVIADDYVDTNYGTGVVKITPAHDSNDFEVGLRHNLQRFSVIDFDGKMTSDRVPKKFRGLTVSQAREAILNELSDQGFIVADEKITHNVGRCYKCDNPIEHLLMDQWFVNVRPLADNAIKAIEEGKIKFYPTIKSKQLKRYYEQIKDWNISRQIVWGIPIPAFQNENAPYDWIYDERVSQETIVVGNMTYRRDPDVFDTWFSSSSWPYMALGYPEGKDFTDFYPLSLMETGVDLLQQWVSRMIMLGLYVTNEVPFKTVYFHGMVTDGEGRKMSKSIGNVLNPMDILNEYGSDAVRIGMISGNTAGKNQPFVISKVVGGRNFCNKLWNIARFTAEQHKTDQENAKLLLNNIADHWIVWRYENILNKYCQLMDAYRFSEAYEIAYHFIWDDLADWYIEASKLQPNVPLLEALLRASLVIAHPFAPFVTETIWQNTSTDSSPLLSGHEFIRLGPADVKRGLDFEKIKEIVVSVRSLKKATGAKKVKLYYHDEPLIAEYGHIIKTLAKLEDVEYLDPGQGITVANNLNCWLDVDQKLIADYLLHLESKISEAKGRIDQLKDRLGNKNYIERAPKDLVEQSRTQAIEAESELEALLQEKVRFDNP